jgi:transcriptional regulator with XRE-family HTH domain
MRDVESLSALIAKLHDNEGFSIRVAPLNDIETKGVLPSVYRLYSFSVLYGMPLLDLLSWYGIPPSSAATEVASSNITLTAIMESMPAPAAGLALRTIREKVAMMTMRDVETVTQKIAHDHSNEELLVSPSRLSDIETKGVLPSIYRLYSLSVVYKLDMGQLLRAYGVDSTLVDAERANLGLRPSDFVISFSSGLTARQVSETLQALANYYRACGGVGFRVDFELEQFLVRELEYV